MRYERHHTTSCASPQLHDAAGLQGSILELAQRLIRLPTRSGIDSIEPAFDLVCGWLDQYRIRHERIKAENGDTVAVWGVSLDAADVPVYFLNATIDTAGFGDEAAWERHPTSGDVADGWLYGRGSADSKVAVAIFCHVIATLQESYRRGGHAYGFFFDANEHTGEFGGTRAFLERWGDRQRIAGVFVGYPGYDNIVAGARGFWRCTVKLSGEAAHSGSSRLRGVNAVAKAGRLILAIEDLDRSLGQEVVGFPVPTKVTATGVRGGGEFSMIPDACAVDIDVRLTPALDAEAIRERLADLVGRLDAELPGRSRSQIVERDGWPAYQLARDSALVEALRQAAESELGRWLPIKVAGPSNIGNLLAQRGIDATCGFGVNYRNAHAVDECVEIDTLVPVFRVYRRAVEKLTAADR